MSNWNFVGRAHRFVYQATRGRIGSRLGGIPMLLLTTRGRRSGEPRTTPLAYMPDGSDCVALASNNGQDHDPAWLLNLRADPNATIEVGSETRAVRAREADGAERAALWPRMLEVNSLWERYPKQTTRDIAVVVLSVREPEPRADADT